jgi:hypothetical protein
MMTERMAWSWLYSQWNQQCQTEIQLDDSRIINLTNDGLCYSLSEMKRVRLISYDTYVAMKTQLRTYAPPEQYGESGEYRWPIGDRASRAAFCLRMVELEDTKE